MKTGKAVLFRVLVTSLFLFWFGGETATHGDIVPQPPPSIGPYLSLSIMPSTSSGDPHERLLASTPLILNFVLRCQDGIEVNCESGETFNLYELRYSVEDPQHQEFFSDRIDLYGCKGPGTLEVYPGIDVPLGVGSITVSATLHYQRISRDGSYVDLSAEATRKQDVWELDTKYLHYRYGFIKRHILNSGRAMPDIWLKEYEPGKDRKELLYHSRTSKFSEDQEKKTRVYVPWIDKCDNFITPEGEDGEGCGLSVAEGSYAIYGGGENPLLRNGLAMATFAKEYLGTGNIKSLDYAVHLFQYIEKSEWIDPWGNRTGFFLRSDYPGLIKVPGTIPGSGEQYLFASGDEIIGMTLGLYYLNEALKVAPNQLYPNTKNDLVDLVHRIGTQLKNNYYFIVPLKKVEGEDRWVRWYSLPNHRHKGWSALYPFQWFMAGGFKAITGQGYVPPDQLTLNVVTENNFWKRVETLTRIRDEDEDDDIIVAEAAIMANKSSRERAELTIMGIGIGMYFSEYPFELGDITIDKVPEFPRFNFAMLLHAFQFGMADYERSTEARASINRLMRELILGVLVDVDLTDVKIDVDICDVFQGFGGVLGRAVGAVVGTLVDLWKKLAHCEYTFDFGTRTADGDFYSAAVARAYTLPDTYDQASQDRRQHMWILIDDTIRYVPDKFASDLAVGERQKDVSGYIDHNPDPKKIGTTFMWEHGVDGYIKGHEDGLCGLANVKIQDLIDRGYDAMKEGAGLDYLWPQALIGFLYPGNIWLLECFEPVDVPYFPACSTQPRLLAPSAPDTDSPCSFSFPVCDEEDVFENNDSYLDASLLSVDETYDGLNIHTQTHSSYRRIQYATYTSDDGTYEIPLVADYDYYELVNNEGNDVTVSVQFDYSGKLFGDFPDPDPFPIGKQPDHCVPDIYAWAHRIRLIVDGEEAQLTDADVEAELAVSEFSGGDVCTFHIIYTKGITVSGKPKHTIMVTGQMGEYSITTNAMVPGDLGGDDDVD